MHKHYTKYNHGDIVFLKTDPDQNPRMITVIKIFPAGITYNLSFGSHDSDHYEMEISTEPNELTRLGLKD